MMQSVSFRWADHKNSRLRFFLIFCAFMMAANIGNARWFTWFTPEVKDIVGHKGFTWKSEDTATVRFYFESGSYGEKNIDRLKENAEQSRQRVLALLGEQVYQDRVTIFVLDSRARMQTLIGKEVNGVGLSKRNALLYVYSKTINASGPHELCHVMAKNLWGETADWMNEGLAVYSDDGWQQYQLHDLAKHLMQRSKLIPLEEVIEHFDKYPELITYPESGSFVKFLYEKYGMNTVKEIWRKGASAIPRITGKNFDDIEKEWHDVIRQSDASKIKYVERWKL